MPFRARSAHLSNYAITQLLDYPIRRGSFPWLW